MKNIHLSYNRLIQSTLGEPNIKGEGGNVISAQYCTNHAIGNCSLTKRAKRVIIGLLRR